jgi:hypothetical protein
MSDNLTDTDEFTPLYISVGYGNLELRNLLSKDVAALNNSKNMVSHHWWWMLKVQNVTHYFTEILMQIFYPRIVSSTIIRDKMYIDKWS